MNVAILGLGVVGKGVYDIITNDFDDITVKYILEKDDEKVKGLEHLRAVSFDDILNDQEIDVVIELIGGKSVAYEYVKKALKNKLHVVTANKALMSEYFEELTSLASNNKVSLLYEASVGGAIIILDELKRIANINHINKIEGIVNGSTNYILSRVFQDDLSMEDAISEAFDQGYLETGSNDDIEGLDALRKLNILSMLSYHTYLKESDYYTVPLSSISKELIDYIKTKGLLLKYTVSSELIDGSIVGHVTPVVLDNNSLLSRINYEENMITLYGAYHKKQSFIGQGAGRYPTASAILYDLINIKENNGLESNHTNTYKINKDAKKYHFLVHSKKGIYQTNKMTFKEILDDEEVICFAKVEEGNYEES